MANPFKPDDKVVTKLKGVEVEATVRLVWQYEVQVRTPDGILRWRAARTVSHPQAVQPGATAATAAEIAPSPTEVQPTGVATASPAPSPTASMGEVASCEVPEAVADKKRAKKKGRRH